MHPNGRGRPFYDTLNLKQVSYPLQEVTTVLPTLENIALRVMISRHGLMKGSLSMDRACFCPVPIPKVIKVSAKVYFWALFIERSPELVEEESRYGEGNVLLDRTGPPTSAPGVH